MADAAVQGVPVGGDKNGPHDYEIENAARTLMEAEDIKANKKLMPHVHKHLKKKARAIRSVQQLRDKHNAMALGTDHDEDDK